MCSNDNVNMALNILFSVWNVSVIIGSNSPELLLLLLSHVHSVFVQNIIDDAIAASAAVPAVLQYWFLFTVCTQPAFVERRKTGLNMISRSINTLTYITPFIVCPHPQSLRYWQAGAYICPSCLILIATIIAHLTDCRQYTCNLGHSIIEPVVYIYCDLCSFVLCKLWVDNYKTLRARTFI